MEKSSKETSPKIKHLIKTAEELFSRYGIRRVSIEEICQKAGVSKMTFYRHFSNKTAIAKYILGKIFSETREKRDAIMAMRIPFEEKIQKMLIMRLEITNRYSREFISELLTGFNSELKKYMEEQNKKYIRELKKILINAQKKGDIRPDIKIDFIMYMMNIMREIFEDENLLKLYPNISALIKDVFNFFYYGILKRRASHLSAKAGKSFRPKG
jgi:AcrR family transcriptional regulator